MKVLLTVIFVIIQLFQFGPAQSSKFPIQVYYESLCPDSVRFIRNQLKPNFEHFKDYVDILFIPFGKSFSTENADGTYSFDCQHGPNECRGNRAQSCVLNQLAESNQAQMDFVACQMSANNDDLTGAECAKKVNVEVGAISECFDGPLGTQLQLEAEQLTKAISPKFVPTIVYNWQFSQELQDRSLNTFKTVVCEQIHNAAPVCE